MARRLLRIDVEAFVGHRVVPGMVPVLVRAAHAQAIALVDWRPPRAARDLHLHVVAPRGLVVDGLRAEEQRAAEAATCRRTRVAAAPEVGDGDLDAPLMDMTGRPDDRPVDGRGPLDRPVLVVADRPVRSRPAAIARHVEGAPEDD